MSNHLAVVAVLAATVVCGCTVDKVVGRYKSAVCETVPATQASAPSAVEPVPCASVFPTASAYAVSIATPPSSSPTTGASLPERAAAAYIAALVKFGKTPDDLRANLAAPIAAGGNSSTAENRSVFHRTIVVSVRKDGGFNPADRLDATDVVIRPYGARFDNWDTLATAYTTINAGAVQLTQARGFTENLTVGTPASAPVSGSLALGASQTDTRVENISALSQTETLTATIEDNGRALRIHRQGGYGIDLTGNTVIKADLTYTGEPSPDRPYVSNPVSTFIFSASPYTDAKGHLLPEEKVTLTAKPLTTLPPGTDVKSEVNLTYTIRHVLSGGDTYEEKDDDVVERTVGPISNKVTLIPAREASPPGFGLHLTTGPNMGFVVYVARPGRATVGLCFGSESEASDLLAYMRAANASHPSIIGNSRLGVVRPDLNPDAPPLLPLTTVDLRAAQVQPKCF